MINRIKNKIVMASIIAPVHAALDLKPQGGDFSSLENVSINKVVSGAISLSLIVATVVFFLILILGAFKLITSSGDEKKVAGARSQITNAFIGLAIILSVWAILSLIDILFGIKILEGLSIPSFIEI